MLEWLGRKRKRGVYMTLEEKRIWRNAHRAKNKEKVNAKARAYRAANSERVNDAVRAYRLKNVERLRLRDAKRSASHSIYRASRAYGIPLEAAQKLRAEPNCYACNIALVSGNKLENSRQIDHCHASGKVRGVLCKRCNVILGYARDSREVLAGLLYYLERKEA